ncbi:MAG: amidohydrolase family protein [Magnetococcales bacterium]|nr:amidohydrolase family protein [Magnetococcales bacterium]MBF0115679.1 amidohydrolase family protein [Magnetococcales bacterium]
MNSAALPPVIDMHLHLDERRFPSAMAAAAQLQQEMVETGVVRGLVLHLLKQPWSIPEVAEALAAHDRLRGLVNVHPCDENAASTLQQAIEQWGFIGLKLHPRVQHFSLDEPQVVALVRQAGRLAVPVLIDAFPDGDALMAGFDPLAYARLAKACPETRLIFAHFGGHKCLDFLMLAKRLPNVWLDFSYSLLYYRGASVVKDLTYCCRSLRYESVFYGSDYPDRSMAESLQESIVELNRHAVPAEAQRKLLFENARQFLQWNDL